jgi:hypothetical protein
MRLFRANPAEDEARAGVWLAAGKRTYERALMKRFLWLLALSVSVARAEEVKLSKNVIMHVDKGLISVKAGTVVQVISRDEKTITIKAEGKTGTIPLDSLEAPLPGKAGTAAPTSAPTPTIKRAETTAAKPTPVASTPPPAVSTYGKMVEKARDATDKHEKATTDDGLLESRK